MGMYNFDFNAGSTAHEKAKYFGKYPGVVVNNGANKEEDDLKRGELKVCVAGILEEITEKPKKSTGTSNPKPENIHASRVKQGPIVVIAKPCFQPGFFFLPEEKDPVWIEFVCGDINHPVWTGVWYPKDRAPKTAKDDEAKYLHKIIRTKSGHIIELTDTEDEEHILIQHKTGSSIEIDPEGKISLGIKGEEQQPIVLGDTLQSKLKDLISIVENHVHPTGVGPSGKPVTSAPGIESLTDTLGEILSKHTTD